MNTYLVLIRGINVGGKSSVSMVELKAGLEAAGLQQASTYLNTGNVMVASDHSAATVKTIIEDILTQQFQLDTALNKVMVLTRDQLQAIVNNKPKGFGEQPELYHSDVIFLMDMAAAEVMPLFKPREGVDTIWPGPGVVFSQRLSALRTKSRLNVIMSTPAYKSMTIRTWNTTTKLLALLDGAAA